MKSKSLFLLAIVFVIRISAQSGINNLSFENWSLNLIGMAPSGWFGQGISMQSSGAQHGTKFLRMTSGSLVPSFLMLGTVPALSGTLTGGAPYTQEPVAISGFYRLSGGTATASPLLNSYTKGQGNVNNLAAQIFSTNVNNWTSFSVPYLPLGVTSNLVDSIFIVVNSIGSGTGSNLVLDLDNLRLETSVGIDEVSLGTAFLVYPNPSSGTLHIFSQAETSCYLQVFGSDGKEILSNELPVGDNLLNLETLAPGIYLYKIHDKQGHLLLSNKLLRN